MEKEKPIMNRAILWTIIAIFFLTAYFLGRKREDRAPVAQAQEVSALTSPQPLWQYQCIDTMKTSRDKARAWKEKTDLEAHIEKETQAIESIGANCVALDTPYDDEFLPYLKVWVKKAREHNLHVWFRGNFSAWEGWFGYPKGMTTAEHLEKTKRFIIGNPTLFADGDSFTPSPEAENGGPFNQVEPNEYGTFRKYLIDEYSTAKDAFAKINKTVATNWLSMNGGLAKRMLDKPTIEAIGGVVTIDHYIKTKEEMASYINYFQKNFGAKVVLGEFGAPIPDINGSMDETGQAAFVSSLLDTMFQQGATVPAVNYWVLYDSSTALVNANFVARPVVAELQKYFQPGVVRGKVTDRSGKPAATVVIATTDSVAKTTTSATGEYQLTLPEGNHTITFSKDSYKTVSKTIAVQKKTAQTVSLTLQPARPRRSEQIRLFLDNLLQRYHQSQQ